MLKTMNFIISIFFLLFISCNLSNKKPPSDFLFETALGMSLHTAESTNKDSMAHFFRLLENSDDSSAKIWLQKKYDIQVYGDFIESKGLRLKKPEESFLGAYLCYRYNELYGEFIPAKLFSNLNEGSGIVNKTGYETLNKLQDVEYNYLQFQIATDGNVKKSNLEFIKLKLDTFPSSNRLKYIFANINEQFGQFNVAIPIYKSLLRDNYYAYNILRTLVKHYNKINLDSCKYYSQLLQYNFPDKCNIDYLRLNVDPVNLLECSKCLRSTYEDSISARILITKSYLNENNYTKVEQMFSEYSKKNEVGNFDSLKIWETGEYYDLMLQMFFKRKDYKGFVDFLFKEMEYTETINIKNADDFSNLIKRYYFKYNPNKDERDFRDFFKLNFYFDVPKKFEKEM